MLDSIGAKHRKQNRLAYAIVGSVLMVIFGTMTAIAFSYGKGCSYNPSSTSVKKTGALSLPLLETTREQKTR